MKYSFILLAVACVVVSNFITLNAQIPYQGKPYNNAFQQIPGKVQCEFFDLGGEGVAYHDTDSVNNGSGKLNPANGSFLNEFRMKEGVDISYTKSNSTDNNPYNFVEPKMDQLYVGWTVPGEWINYSVEVQKSADYHVGIMYTCNGDGVISLSIDNKDITGPIHLMTTHQDKDSVAWRQWHHWNKIDAFAKVKLDAGKHILTIRTVESGNMNYDYLEFREAK